MTNLVSAAVLASQLVMSNTAAQAYANALQIANYANPEYAYGDTLAHASRYRNCVEVPILLRDANHNVISTNYLDVTEFYNFVQSVRQVFTTFSRH